MPRARRSVQESKFILTTQPQTVVEALTLEDPDAAVVKKEDPRGCELLSGGKPQSPVSQPETGDRTRPETEQDRTSSRRDSPIVQLDGIDRGGACEHDLRHADRAVLGHLAGRLELEERLDS